MLVGRNFSVRSITIFCNWRLCHAKNIPRMQMILKVSELLRQLDSDPVYEHGCAGPGKNAHGKLGSSAGLGEDELNTTRESSARGTPRLSHCSADETGRGFMKALSYTSVLPSGPGHEHVAQVVHSLTRSFVTLCSCGPLWLERILDWHIRRVHEAGILSQVFRAVETLSPVSVSEFSTVLLNHFTRLTSADAIDEYLQYLAQFGSLVGVNYLSQVIPVIGKFGHPTVGVCKLVSVLLSSNPVVAHSLIQHARNVIGFVHYLDVPDRSIGSILRNLLEIVLVGRVDLIDEVSDLMEFVRTEWLVSESDLEREIVTKSLVESSFLILSPLHPMAKEIGSFSDSLLERVMDRSQAVRACILGVMDEECFSRISSIPNVFKCLRVCVELGERLPTFELTEGHVRLMEMKAEVRDVLSAEAPSKSALATLISRLHPGSDSGFIKGRVKEFFGHLDAVFEIMEIITHTGPSRANEMLDEFTNECPDLAPDWISLIRFGFAHSVGVDSLLLKHSNGSLDLLRRLARIATDDEVIRVVEQMTTTSLVHALGDKHRSPFPPGRHRGIVEKLLTQQTNSRKLIYLSLFLDWRYTIDKLPPSNEAFLALAKWAAVHDKWNEVVNREEPTVEVEFLDEIDSWKLRFLLYPDEGVSQFSPVPKMIGRISSFAYITDIRPEVLRDVILWIWSNSNETPSVIAKLRSRLFPNRPSAIVRDQYNGVRVDLIPVACSACIGDEIVDRLETVADRQLLIEYVLSVVAYLGLIGLMTDRARFHDLIRSVITTILSKHDASMIAVASQCIASLRLARPVGIAGNGEVFNLMTEVMNSSFPSANNMLVDGTYTLRLPPVLFEPTLCVGSTRTCTVLLKRKRRGLIH
jgi:hypothetical protein